MDRRNWEWMASHMPGVVAQLREYREAGEGAHLDECWRKGVVGGAPGWFFAVEGPISLGTPFEAAPTARDAMVSRARAQGGACLVLAPLPAGRVLPGRQNAQQRSARAIVAGNLSEQMEAAERAGRSAHGA